LVQSDEQLRIAGMRSNFMVRNLKENAVR